MVEIGGRPILWHIMKIYAAYGYREFVLALGYKGEMIQEYFLNFHRLDRNVSVELSRRLGDLPRRAPATTGWCTWSTPGIETKTGGRLRRLRHMIARRALHADLRRRRGRRRHRPRWSPSTARTASSRRSPPCGRPRASAACGSTATAVAEFEEKPQIGEGWINGGFFVFEPERARSHPRRRRRSGSASPLERLAADGQLMAYRHDGFWQSWTRCATSSYLETPVEPGQAPWKVWT